jgi:hypothetical protein
MRIENSSEQREQNVQNLLCEIFRYSLGHQSLSDPGIQYEATM